MMIAWLKINVVIALFYLCFRLCGYFLNREDKQDLSKSFLQLLPLVILIPGLMNLMPVEIELAPVQVRQEKHQGPSFLNFPKEVVNNKISKPSGMNSTSFYSFDFDKMALSLFSLGALLSLLKILYSVYTLKKMAKESFSYKSLMGLKILVSQNISNPISFQFWSKYILIPESLLLNQKNLSLALRHEIQHHRTSDGLLSLAVELLGILFFLNPFYHLWKKEAFLQLEIRCDKEVISRKQTNLNEYVNLLVRTASSEHKLQTLSLAMAMKGNLLRRIEVITSKKKQRGGSRRLGTVLALSLVTVCLSAYAARNNYQLKKLSMSELKQMTSQMKSDIPLDVNSKVLKWVNHYLGTEGGRAYLVSSQARYSNIKSKLLKRIKREKMPEELVGVALMESGFRNNVKSPAKAAGVWQFIPSTARRYGLKVEGSLDERKKISKATGAAMKYYRDLLKIPEFKKDWRLVLLAYNSGERSLRESLVKTGSLNPWEQKVGDKEYLAKVLAGMILMKMPKNFVFVKPLNKAKMTSSFGPRYMKLKGGKHFHKGVDLATKIGTEIISPLAGKVIEASSNYRGNKAYGNAVVIQHEHDVITKYFHLHNFHVKAGDQVKAGQIIGEVGSTGLSTGPHLHFELYVNNDLVDPSYFL